MNTIKPGLSGGYPFDFELVSFWIDGVQKALSGALSAFDLQNGACILSGCEVTDNNCSAGYLYYKGQIVRVPAHSFAAGNNLAFVYKEHPDALLDPVEFFDEGVHNIHLNVFCLVEPFSNQLNYVLISNCKRYHDVIKQNHNHDDSYVKKSTMVELIKRINPVGEVKSFVGSIDNIPVGFVLCDGQNGTPDMRDRFQVGAGLTYNTGDIGGLNEVELTVEQMPPHAHNVTAKAGESSGIGALAGGTQNALDDGTATTSSVGGGQAHENRPPFFALAFIMRVSHDDLIALL